MVVVLVLVHVLLIVLYQAVVDLKCELANRLFFLIILSPSLFTGSTFVLLSTKRNKEKPIGRIFIAM